MQCLPSQIGALSPPIKSNDKDEDEDDGGSEGDNDGDGRSQDPN